MGNIFDFLTFVLVFVVAVSVDVIDLDELDGKIIVSKSRINVSFGDGVDAAVAVVVFCKDVVLLTFGLSVIVRFLRDMAGTKIALVALVGAWVVVVAVVVEVVGKESEETEVSWLLLTSVVLFFSISFGCVHWKGKEKQRKRRKTKY